MGMIAPVYYTADMVRALPEDGNRYEVVYGELLVTPAPRVWHQELAVRLARTVSEYLEREPVGHLLPSPADISWTSDTLVQPDLFVAPLDQVRTLDWTQVKDLLLVIEVLSPSTLRYDRFTKRRLYRERRIPSYWAVDGEERWVEVWTPAAQFPTVERVRLVWHPAGAREAFSVELRELFRPI